MTVVQGPLITEIRQTFSSYASHVIRLINGSDFIEIEWTAGPIPATSTRLPDTPAPGGCVGWVQTENCTRDRPDPDHKEGSCAEVLKPKAKSGYCVCAKGVRIYGQGCGGPVDDKGNVFKNCEDACNAPIRHSRPATGKEIILKFASNLASNGKFYTDSNGREMVPRVRDARGPSYPPLVVNEPVAGNYYPVNSLISLDDGSTEMSVVTDVSMGGSSMQVSRKIAMISQSSANYCYVRTACPGLSDIVNSINSSPLLAFGYRTVRSS